jgi:hypothetical protein
MSVSQGERKMLQACLINLAGDTEIGEYRLDPTTARAVLTIDQPAQFTNHKGGWLGLGPDGKLCIASGDGGGSDPLGSGQNHNTLLGKMPRIDVDTDGFPADPARNCAIPADNPFVGAPGLDEIWAGGWPTPWRNSFERATGQIFIADVGQGARQEIKLVSLANTAGTWTATDRAAQLVYSGPGTGTISAHASFGEDAEGRRHAVDIDGDIFRLSPRLVSADRAEVVKAGGGGGADTGDGVADFTITLTGAIALTAADFLF